MPDIKMTWSGDLSISPTGDLATSVGPALGTERVLRRLMTNPRDYIWNPDYGAGLGQFVGRPVNAASIESLIRLQMQIEVAVGQVPEPIVEVRPDPGGELYVQVRYADAVTSESAALAFNVPG